MSFSKNQTVKVRVESLSSDGSGVAHADGEALFLPAAAPGDEIEAKIVKDCGRYAFAIVSRILTPSPARIEQDCPVSGPCGGCCFRHIGYRTELDAKQGFVQDAFDRIGKFSLKVLPILASPEVDRYRNKAQYPIGLDDKGNICAGFYAGRSHRIVPCADCLLQPREFSDITAFLCSRMQSLGIQPYDESSCKGELRHIFIRRGAHSGQILVCLVAATPSLPHGKALAEDLMRRFPAVRSVMLNVNARRTNVILGEENHVLAGESYIEDTLCGVPIHLGPLSFYQVNTPAAEQLYRVAAADAALQPDDHLLDLYCGMGTIGLSMIGSCAELTGVEVIPEAVEAARANAAAMGGGVSDKCRFLCADAGAAAAALLAEEKQIDAVILDPPRKGCDAAALDAVLSMQPRTIVMVSCNPATAARDCRYLADRGYVLQRVQPADLFPRTRHVEAVALLSRLNAGEHSPVALGTSGPEV